MKWFGYRHTNGSLHTKRYFSQEDFDEANESPFVAQTTGPFEADSGDEARRMVVARFTQIAPPDETKDSETINPTWLKASMTMEQAAKQAAIRNCTLRASFDKLFGLRIVAVRREST